MVISLRHPLFHIVRHVLQDTIHIHFQIKVSKISSLTTQHQPRFMAWLRDYIHIKPWDMSKFQRRFIFSLRESIPRLLNEGTTTMTARCARLAARPPSQTPGGLGQRYWSVSEVTWPPKLELRRWRSSGPSILMWTSTDVRAWMVGDLPRTTMVCEYVSILFLQQC